ncbi:MAG: hypothetical protein J2P57_00375 [Acidimicrobiaceae bacterium]|nr:hypothetical protein [Acidimicrobiaceae bacterium]
MKPELRDLVARMRPGQWARRGRSVAWLHPRWQMAVKAAGAAALAWLVVQPLGGFVQHYPYYAPLGAVVAMSTTVAASARYAVQAVAAILLGAGIALATRATSLSDLVAIAVVIAVGTLLSGWRTLGTMGSWVPVAALFVLILGGTNPWHYVIAYGGLTAIGAAVGLGVNAALPQLRLAPAVRAQARLREEVARQLEELADGLLAPDRLTGGQWEALCATLDPQTRRVDELVTEAIEAQRGNWRAGRWRDLAQRRYDQARALRRLTGCVEEVVALVSDPRSSVHEVAEPASSLRARIAEALGRTARMLRTTEEVTDRARTEAWVAAADSVHGLTKHVTRLCLGPDGRYLTAVAIAVALQRAVDAWA